jgi:hypothetical protein
VVQSKGGDRKLAVDYGGGMFKGRPRQSEEAAYCIYNPAVFDQFEPNKRAVYILFLPILSRELQRELQRMCR